jgi:antitoxin (DNA-binding transcriptional repressor) of toxin-antitoxin stability system
MIKFDFPGLGAASTAEGRLVAELVATIRSQRGAVRPSDGAIAIRRRDLRALSDLLEIPFDDFVQRLRDEGVLRKPVGRPRRAGDAP